jgi:hypothetical protein
MRFQCGVTFPERVSDTPDSSTNYCRTTESKEISFQDRESLTTKERVAFGTFEDEKDEADPENNVLQMPYEPTRPEGQPDRNEPFRLWLRQNLKPLSKKGI